jgi:hypothetical protein
MDILAGSNETTEPFRRITLYWSRGRTALDETVVTESWRGGTEKEGDTPSEESNIRHPFYSEFQELFGSNNPIALKQKTTISSGSTANFR